VNSFIKEQFYKYTITEPRSVNVIIGISVMAS